MKNVKKLAAMVVVLAVGTSGCGAVAMSPVPGLLYTDVSAPLTATGEPTGTRTGTSECQSILGLVAQGDCSIAAAAEQGGITTISHVDYHTESILGIIAAVTVTVYGS